MHRGLFPDYQNIPEVQDTSYCYQIPLLHLKVPGNCFGLINRLIKLFVGLIIGFFIELFIGRFRFFFEQRVGFCR